LIYTILKALNNSEEISFDAKKIGGKLCNNRYSLNATIAVIIPDIKNDFFAQD